jgi:hypothetical protein
MPAESLPAWAVRLLSELDTADQRAESVARDLNSVQLNWHPRPGAWSVGQCLDHLRLANVVYLPAIALAQGSRPFGRAEEIVLSPFSRWFLRNFIAPNPGGTRAKAPRKIQPVSNVDPSVLDELLRGNQSTRELIRVASERDVNRIRFRNPFIPLLRFTVGTGLELIVKHQFRHLLQAESVRKSPGFPV